MLRLLLVLAAIIIVIVVIVVVARSAIHSGEAADYQKYMTAVADILQQSDAVGSKLQKLLTNPGDVNRAQIQAQLDSFISTSEELQVKAEALKAPKELVTQSVHQIFLLVMSFRQIGTSDLKPSVMSALETQDTEVAAEQISHALTYLVNSDFLYEEVFVPKSTEILQQKQLTGVTVPSTSFISDPNLATTTSVLNILDGLKSAGNLQAVHGVALTKVVAMPDEKVITAGGTFNLTSSSDLTFRVTVENQGNMEEKNIPVVITLRASNAKTAQKVTVNIPQLKAKTETTVEVKGLNPTAYGVTAALTVKVGPVTGEKYQANNSLQAKLIFKL